MTWPLVSWWLMLEGLGLAVFPLLFPLFSRQASHGYPFAKVAALLLLTYVSWLLGFSLPMSAAVKLTLGALVVGGIVAAALQRAAIGAWLSDGGTRVIGIHAALWAFGFLFYAWFRSLAPDIFGAEKYMDFAFFNVLSQTQSMPPYDPWMAGKTINYYYFGYLMFATLARLAPLPNQISYNLCVVTVGGLAFALTAAVTFQITRRWGIAILGGAMSALLGNLDGLLQFIQKGRFGSIDYWRSTRVVGDDGATINEFPFFSTIHGDLHPHFIVLPVGLFLLSILLDESLFPSRPEDARSGARAWIPFAVVAFVLGSIVAVSTWELPMATLVVFILAGRRLPLAPLFGKERLLLVAQTIGIVAVGYILFLPFYTDFVAPTATPGANEACFGPACLKLAETSLGQFLTVFGLLLFAPCVLVAARAWELIPGGREWRHLWAALGAFAILFAVVAGNAVLPLLAALAAGSLLVAYRGSEGPERAGYLLVTAATAALLACEVVYLKDSYGDRLYRMNTVFKLYFQAWTILCVASAWCVHQLLTRKWQWSLMPTAVTAGLALLIAAAALYPLGIALDRGGVPVRTLDGNAYLAREHPGDYAAIVWLRQHARDDEVLLEATGNPYSYYARFSANTGLPTVLGWANHEGLWRAHDRDVLGRHSAVQQAYNAPTLEAAKKFLDQHGVRYVIVGDLERQDYKPEGLGKFGTLPVAFQSGGTIIYEWKKS
jgi:YYY domain-containing protein